MRAIELTGSTALLGRFGAEGQVTTMHIDRRAQLHLALDADEATLETVGGKGAALARMAAAGLPVPPGSHLTTAAYRRFIDAVVSRLPSMGMPGP